MLLDNSFTWLTHYQTIFLRVWVWWGTSYVTSSLTDGLSKIAFQICKSVLLRLVTVH